MVRAASTLMDIESPVLNVFLHSSEMLAGASGRVETGEQVEETLDRIRGILVHCMDVFSAVPATLREAAAALRPSLGL